MQSLSLHRLVGTLLILVSICPLFLHTALAQDIPDLTEEAPVVQEAPREYSLTVGIREWISQGRSAHNIAAPTGDPNVLSELSWRGVNSSITLLTADVVVRRLVADLSIGYGTIGSGTLLDQDWAGNHRTQKDQETLSTVNDGSASIASFDVGVRMLAWTYQENPLSGALDLLIGYQYWREQYVASGVQFIVPPAEPFIPGKALTQTNTWHSFRIGARMTVPLHERVAVKGSAFYIPASSYRNEDIHHLRTDLRKDPSFLTTATGGNGVQLEGSLVVRVWQRLTVEAGYAYWDIRSGTGTLQAFGADGTMGVTQHNEENTRRQGVFFGANWTF